MATIVNLHLVHQEHREMVPGVEPSSASGARHSNELDRETGERQCEVHASNDAQGMADKYAASNESVRERGNRMDERAN